MSGDPGAAAAGLRRIIAAIDPTQPVYDLKTLEEALSASIAPRRFNLLLLAFFAAAALVLAGIGVYGVMSYTVAQRTREIDRLALGARREEVVRMVVRQEMIVAAAGIAGGLATAFALTRLMSTLLYDVKPTDTATFAAVAGLLAAAALLACCVPALRAARVDLVIALRYE